VDDVVREGFLLGIGKITASGFLEYVHFEYPLGLMEVFPYKIPMFAQGEVLCGKDTKF
jgi:hypothetical protein